MFARCRGRTKWNEEKNVSHSQVTKSKTCKKKVKESFDKKVKNDTFLVANAILRWDARNDEKGKHEKFDNLLLGPFTIIKSLGNNTFVLQNLDGDEVPGPVNGWFLKHFHIYWTEVLIFIVYIITVFCI